MKSIKSRDRVSLEAAAEILALPLKGYLHILTRVYKRMHGRGSKLTVTNARSRPPVVRPNLKTSAAPLSLRSKKRGRDRGYSQRIARSRTLARARTAPHVQLRPDWLARENYTCVWRLRYWLRSAPRGWRSSGRPSGCPLSTVPTPLYI